MRLYQCDTFGINTRLLIRTLHGQYLAFLQGCTLQEIERSPVLDGAERVIALQFHIDIEFRRWLEAIAQADHGRRVVRVGNQVGHVVVNPAGAGVGGC